MSTIFIILTILAIFVVIIQVAKMVEYVSQLSGQEKTDQYTYKLNGWLLIVFLLGGLVAVYFCNQALRGKLLPEAASLQGKAIDHMMWVTLIITGIVFVATQIMLFTFSFIFRSRPGRTARYIPPYSRKNTRLEIIWTSATMIVLLILVVIGLRQWFKITGPAPKGAMLLEVTGKQFDWIFRYPGADGELGKKNYQLVDAAKSNPLGQEWSDPKNRDDIVTTGTMHLVVNRPVRLVINSQDVIHDVGLPYFRLKMDAVPGVPTTLWFTPTITTAKMKQITDNPNFVYELACDQLCGYAHYAMRATMIVETQAEFNHWVAAQPSQYRIAMTPSPSDSAMVKDVTLKATASTSRVTSRSGIRN